MEVGERQLSPRMVHFKTTLAAIRPLASSGQTATTSTVSIAICVCDLECAMHAYLVLSSFESIIF